MDPIIIIGTGLAGYSLAKEYRKLNTEAPLCLITSDSGDYYSKPMLSTALTQGKSAENLSTFTAEKMRQQLNAEILTKTIVTNIDPNNKTVTTPDKTLSYDKLVLAWGAEVIRIPIEGDGLDNVYSINDLSDYAQFRQALTNKKEVTILGSGLIGCEFANDLLNAGLKVNIVSLAETPLDNLLPPEAGQALADSLSSEGVTWHWNTTINQVTKADAGKIHIALSNGKTITSDLLVSAIGLKPRTELAEKAGIAVNRGIVVNQSLETSEKDIYALGDCAEVCGHVFQYVMPIMNSARALAKSLAGTTTPVHYPAMPVSIKTPVCPVVVCPPLKNAKGHWDIEQAGKHVKAVFVDAQDKLLGFALTGDRVKDRLQLTTLLPHVLTADNR